MAEMNGQFVDDRAVEIVGDGNTDPKTSDLKVKIAAVEQENLQLAHEKDVIEKKIGEFKKSIEELSIQKEKLVGELQESKDEIKTLKSVAARASDLEGEVSRLQHDFLSTTSELAEVNAEMNAVKSTFETFKKKVGEKKEEFKAKENSYLSDLNEKEKVIVSLKAKVEELNEKEKVIVSLKAKVEELNKERETTAVEDKPSGGEINLGWQVVAGSALGIGLVGLVLYLHQAKRT